MLEGFQNEFLDPLFGSLSQVKSVENEELSLEKSPSVSQKVDSVEDTYEYVTNLAKSRRPTSVQDEIVLIFINSMLDTFIDSWHGKPCLQKKAVPVPTVEMETESQEVVMEASSIADTKQKEQVSPKERRTSSQASRGSQKRKSKLSTKEISARKTSSRAGSRTSARQGKFSRQKLKRKSGSSSNIIGGSEKLGDISSQTLPEEGETEDKTDDTLIDIPDWRLSVPDEIACIKINGKTYKGRISQKRMEGLGKFRWPNGTVYKGNFEDGEMNGLGLITWPDETFYEGEFYCGYRHGEGLFSSNRDRCSYMGQWFLGERHGYGTMFYNHKDNDYYDGFWKNNKRHGEGLRQYESGACYFGQWEDGKMHGLGVMVWPNNDIYRGEWNKGQPYGYGEYTWSAIPNRELFYPSLSNYRGFWANGLRHGYGVLEIQGGSNYTGYWTYGMKEGSACVTARDGTFTSDEKLYLDDRPAPDLTIKSAERNSSHRRLGNKSPRKKDKEKANYRVSETSLNWPGSLPSPLKRVVVNVSDHNLDYSYHIDRWIKTKDVRKPKDLKENADQRSKGKVLTPNTDLTKEEEGTCSTLEPSMIKNEVKWLQQAIVKLLPLLRKLYREYATIAARNVHPNIEPVLARFMLWQMFRDSKITSMGYSLVEIDNIVAQNASCCTSQVHDPFQLIHFDQFLHILLDTSWLLFGSKRIGREGSYGTISSAFQKLVIEVLWPNSTVHIGKALFDYRDVLSLEAVYRLYRSLGEPHTARHLLCTIFSDEPAEPPKGADQNSAWQLRQSGLYTGMNVISPGGDLMYLAPEDFLSYDFKEKEEPPICCELSAKGLTFLKDLGAPEVVQCFADTCPGIVSDDGIIYNIEYDLTFLEFYEIILCCAERRLIKQKEEEERAKMLAEDLEQKKPESDIKESLPTSKTSTKEKKDRDKKEKKEKKVDKNKNPKKKKK